MLERYCGFLNFYNAHGDIMAESRGGKEDTELNAGYRHVLASGTQWRGCGFFQGVLTAKELKLKPKAANIAGLQLADILAHPCKQEILYENGRVMTRGKVFGAEICRAIEDKYNRQVYRGRVEGHGMVFLK